MAFKMFLVVLLPLAAPWSARPAAAQARSTMSAAPRIELASVSAPPVRPKGVPCRLEFPPGIIEVPAAELGTELLERRGGADRRVLRLVKAVDVRFDAKTAAMLPSDREAFLVLARCAAATDGALAVRVASPPGPEMLTEAARRAGEILRFLAAEGLRQDRISVEVVSRRDQEHGIQTRVVLASAQSSSGVVEGSDDAKTEAVNDSEPTPLAAGPETKAEGARPSQDEGEEKLARERMASAEREARAAETAKEQAERDARAGQAKLEAERQREAKAAEASSQAAERASQVAEEARVRAEAAAEQEARQVEAKASALAAKEAELRAISDRLVEAERASQKRDAAISEKASALDDRAKKLTLQEKMLVASGAKLRAVGDVEKELAAAEKAQKDTEKRLLAEVASLFAAESKRKREEANLLAEIEKVRGREAATLDKKVKVDLQVERLKLEEDAARVREMKEVASRQRSEAQEKQIAAREQRLASWEKRLEAVGGAQEELRPGDAGRRQIEEAIEFNRGAIRRCVESHLKRTPQAIHAKGVLKITVDARGRVSAAAIAEGALMGTFLESCIKQEAKAWHFPASSEEYELQVPITVVGREGG